MVRAAQVMAYLLLLMIDGKDRVVDRVWWWVVADGEGVWFRVFGLLEVVSNPDGSESTKRDPRYI